MTPEELERLKMEGIKGYLSGNLSQSRTAEISNAVQEGSVKQVTSQTSAFDLSPENRFTPMIAAQANNKGVNTENLETGKISDSIFDQIGKWWDGDKATSAVAESQPTFRLNPEANRAAFDALNEKYPSANFNMYLPDVDWSSPEAEAKFQATVPDNLAVDPRGTKEGIVVNTTNAESELVNPRVTARQNVQERDAAVKADVQAFEDVFGESGGDVRAEYNEHKDTIEALSGLQERYNALTPAQQKGRVGLGLLKRIEDLSVNKSEIEESIFETEEAVYSTKVDTKQKEEAKPAATKEEVYSGLGDAAKSYQVHTDAGDAEGQANVENGIIKEIERNKGDEGFLDKLNSWIVDNPALASGIGNALVGFISTGSAYKALGLGIQGYINGVGKADADKKAWDKIGRDLMIDDGATPASVKKYLKTQNIEDLVFSKAPPEIKSDSHGSKWVGGRRYEFWNTQQGIWIRNPNGTGYIPAKYLSEDFQRYPDFDKSIHTKKGRDEAQNQYAKEQANIVSNVMIDSGVPTHKANALHTNHIGNAIDSLRTAYGLDFTDPATRNAAGMAMQSHVNSEAARWHTFKDKHDEKEYHKFKWDTNYKAAIEKGMIKQQLASNSLPQEILLNKDGEVDKKGTSKLYRKINNFINHPDNKGKTQNLGSAIKTIYNEWVTEVHGGNKENALKHNKGESAFLRWADEHADFVIEPPEDK
jgi:hypothetical protein